MINQHDQGVFQDPITVLSESERLKLRAKVSANMNQFVASEVAITRGTSWSGYDTYQAHKDELVWGSMAVQILSDSLVALPERFTLKLLIDSLTYFYMMPESTYGGMQFLNKKDPKIQILRNRIIGFLKACHITDESLLDQRELFTDIGCYVFNRDIEVCIQNGELNILPFDKFSDMGTYKLEIKKRVKLINGFLANYRT